METYNSRFQSQLAAGQAGETAISRWLRQRGYYVMPVYEKEYQTGKGPRLFCPSRTLIAPDMFAFKGNDKAYWIEAKHKTAFSWHRVSGRWVTGIDLRHYEDYCHVDDNTPWPVWLMFLHRGGKAKDSPDQSPAGLFGNRLSTLRKRENHRSSKWGATGMVYWSIEVLHLLAPISDFF